MFSKKCLVLLSLLLAATLILTACEGETVVETKVVEVEKQVKVTKVVQEVVTQIVEKEGEKVIETQVVEKEVVVTATPEPEPTEPPMAKIAPDFKNPDTYMIVTGAGEPETLDPSFTYESAAGTLENNIYEGLVFFNHEKTDEFIPALATRWESDETGVEWVFTIREGITFHEGGTLEPHDVAYSFHRAMLQDRIDGPQWMMLEALFGLYSVESLAMENAGVESFEDVPAETLVATCERIKAAVVADDEAGTVTFKLGKVTPWFMPLLSYIPVGAVYDMEWMIENGDWDNDCATWVQWHDPVAEDTILFDQANGTGPYILDHWTPGEEIVLVANENYWRTEPMWEGGPSGPPSIKRVVSKNVNEWGTRLAMFEAGDADFVYVPSQYRPQLEPYYKTICYADSSCEEGNPGGYIQVHRDLPSPAMTNALFNWQINIEGGNPYVGSGELDGNGIPPDFFQDIHVRRAFNYCFDFDTMIQDALNGEGWQSQGPIIAGMMGYREGEDPLYSYDLEKCEEEFKLAFDGELWENGFYMQLGYNTGNDTRRLTSEILKAGIESVNSKFSVAVVGMPWPVLLNTRRAGKLPIYVGAWHEDYHDPHNWVLPYLHSQGTYGRVINFPEEMAAEYDALIEEAASYSTVEERRPIYEQLQLKAQEDAAVIWMFQTVTRLHFQDWIKGFYFNPAYSHSESEWIYALSKEAP